MAKYKIIADFPGNPFPVGTIISDKIKDENSLSADLIKKIGAENLKLFPNLFKKIDYENK